MFSSGDQRWMKAAIELGRRGTGYTEPNPLVGAVVVRAGRLISSGWHRYYGAEHAEAMALNPVSEAGTTLYVPLEPCSHFGKTPPCTELIIAKRVKRVVIALQDPNPLVNGQGIRTLEENRIPVERGCLGDLYSRVNRHYLAFMTRRRPHVTLKAGVSLDGKMTDRFRASRWVTDEKLRRLSRSLRGEFSAILVGDRTIRDDDPGLMADDTDWPDKKLWRVVLDTRNQLDPEKQVFRNQERFPLMIFSAEQAENRTPKTEHHHFVPASGEALDLPAVLEILFKKGIASVLVEGGGGVIDSFIRQRLADEMVLFTARKLIGGTGSVELFASGAGIDEPVTLADPDVLDLSSGLVIRGPLRYGGAGG